mgnify:CR=1 FL=1
MLKKKSLLLVMFSLFLAVNFSLAAEKLVVIVNSANPVVHPAVKKYGHVEY